MRREALQGMADEIHEALLDLDLPKRAVDGDCLPVSGAVVACLKDHGFDAHVIFVTGWVSFQGQRVVGFMHAAVTVGAYIVDATATQFDPALPSIIIAPEQEYREVMQRATSVSEVTLELPSGRALGVASRHGVGPQAAHRGRGAARGRPGAFPGAGHRLAGDERRRPGQPGVGQEPTKPPYSVKATKSAISDFNGLQPNERTRVSNAIQKCRWEPHTFSKPLGAKLGGFRKIEVGDHLRVVLGIENKHITIYAVGQHENFYTRVIRRMKQEGMI